MDQNTVQVRKMFEARILARVHDDPAFHRRLIENPRAAVEEEMGIVFPADSRVAVVEEPANTLLLVVPPVPAADGELSDAQLAGVAGGLMSAGELWTAIKKALGGGKFEVSTERAVAGVRG